MSKNKKLIVLMLSVLCAICMLAACGEKKEDNIELAFKDDMISSVVVNTEVDLAPYVTYTEGYSAKMTATYVKDGKTESYDTYGLTFTATEIEDVTVTITLKDTDKSISKVITVTVPAPVISEKKEAVAYINEETTLADLAQFVTFTSQKASPSVFKVLSVSKGETEIDLSDKEVYTFDTLGTYTLKFEITNAGGRVEDTLTLGVKRNLPEKEIDDASNWMKSWAPASEPQKDTELHAENSDWSYRVYAGTDMGQYWANFAILKFDEPVDLTKQYVSFDIYVSADARPLILIDFFKSEEELINNTPQKTFELTPETWTNITTKDLVLGNGNTEFIKEGGHSLMRINFLQKEGLSVGSENCFIAVDNVTVGEYQGYTYEKIDNEWKKVHDYYLGLNGWFLNEKCNKDVIWLAALDNDAPLDALLQPYGLTYSGFTLTLNGTALTSATMHAYAGANWFWVVEFQGTYTTEEGRTGTEIKNGDHISIANGATFTDTLGITYRFAGFKVFSDDKNTQLVFENEDFNMWYVNGAWTYVEPAAE